MGQQHPEPEPTIPFPPYPVSRTPEPGFDPYPEPYGQVVPYGQPQPQPQPHPQPQPQNYGYGYPPAPQQGYPVQPWLDPRQQAYQMSLYAAQKSRLAAGLLGIFLGTLGIHNFYLGRTGIAVLQLLLSLLSVGFLAPVVWIWALIEGIMILAGAASFRTDAKGIPLRD